MGKKKEVHQSFTCGECLRVVVDPKEELVCPYCEEKKKND